MKITIIGATGGTGSHAVRQALAQGHQVTAVVREPSRLDVPRQPALDVLRANPADAEALLPAVEGRDAVVTALGPRPGDRAGICGSGARALAAALPLAGVRRVVAVSAAPLAPGGEGPLMRWVAKPLLWRILRESYQDLRRMEDALAGSGLDWTVIRPPKLTNGPHTGRYRRATDLAVRGGLRISRADTADACLAALADPDTIGHALAVAY